VCYNFWQPQINPVAKQGKDYQQEQKRGIIPEQAENIWLRNLARGLFRRRFIHNPLSEILQLTKELQKKHFV
jgi:hypothetical protein